MTCIDRAQVEVTSAFAAFIIIMLHRIIAFVRAVVFLYNYVKLHDESCIIVYKIDITVHSVTIPVILSLMKNPSNFSYKTILNSTQLSWLYMDIICQLVYILFLAICYSL